VTPTLPDASIRPYNPSDKQGIVALSLRAWKPVFASFAEVWGRELYHRFFPDWGAQQTAAVEDAIDRNETWVSLTDSTLSGFVNVSFDETEKAAEIYMIAVEPRFQRRGIATGLTEFALSVMGERGVTLATVATGADPGHVPARRTYEKTGFTPIHQILYAKVID
jgi:ribosomal protein S18 acetylase RimI-like enzyme